jgi:putative Mn2+ efflux pump MntP
MIGGLVTSLLVFAVGAILDFAVTVTPYQHGINVRTIGVILMIAAAAGALISDLAFAFGGTGRRRHRTVIEDGRGNVRRDDTFV